ncbi:MAG: DUF5302 domain-containing protein [Micropruina sp.]|nr:DUF5302 domain-containing protein [Micropruina sp.]
MTAPEQGSDPKADQKAAFKAALDRKKATAQGGPDHIDSDRSTGRSQNAQGGKREFRRKSGG